MIEVIIRHAGSEVELGRIEIENVDTQPLAEYASYSVRFGVEKIGAVGIHQRGILHFPRQKYNVLALLLQALNTLSEDELKFVGDWEERDPMAKLKELGRRWWR